MPNIVDLQQFKVKTFRQNNESFVCDIQGWYYLAVNLQYATVGLVNMIQDGFIGVFPADSVEAKAMYNFKRLFAAGGGIIGYTLAAAWYFTERMEVMCEAGLYISMAVNSFVDAKNRKVTPPPPSWLAK